MPLKILKYQVLETDSGRVDVLIARLLGYPRSRVRGLMDHEGIMLNGQDCRDPGRLVARDDQVVLRFDPQRKYREKPPERKTHGFQILYRDEHLVVVQKDAGLLTVPTDRRETNTLADRLAQHLAAGTSRIPKLAVVHRLDKDTSGLLVFGLNQAIGDHLIKQFAARKPEREYYGIVAGNLQEDHGEIRSFLKTDKALNQKSAPEGQLAITHFRVLARSAQGTLVAVNLETGRRNQIRVHFAEKGHPILGDQRYETQLASHPSWPYRRLALHARLLGFNHPINKKDLHFEAALPDEFKKYMKANSLKG